MKKVLVVEDHPGMLEVLTLQLEMLGLNVVSAKDGEEGVEKAMEEKPHLILMDIMMPGMDGRSAARMIRSMPEIHDTPILATTVLFRELDLKSCIEAGCSDYLVKPFTFKELQGKIREFIPNGWVPV